MIVDDSAVVRGLIARILDADGDIAVVASVGDGLHALRILRREEVDVVLLDIEMQMMDGLTALPKMLAARPRLRIIIVSALTRQNAELSLRALSMGAVDYLNKPSSRDDLLSADSFSRELLRKVHGLGVRTGDDRAASGTHDRLAHASPISADDGVADGPSLRPGSSARPEILAVGSSTGGPEALKVLLQAIDRTVTLPIVITQHMPAAFTAILAKNLGQASGRPSAEPKDGEPISAGHIYVAPGDRHMLVERRNGMPVIRLSDGAPENFCRPSVDPMLRSLAETYGPGVVAVILTGMGQDGRAGSTVVVEMGGTVIAQDEESSVVWGMPGAVATDGLCTAVLALDEIGHHISNLAA